MTGAPAKQDGLSQAEPSSTVSALTGFDPSRLRDLARRYVENATFMAQQATSPRANWQSTDFVCADAAIRSLEFAWRCEGMASAIEAEGQDRAGGLGAKHESATRQGDAQ